MESDLVSIGMPVYNDRNFLPIALSSLQKQTYSNFELIIADDCSTDGSEDICREAMMKDGRIKYFRHVKNMGISRNMEFLLRQAKGNYFMWAGNDDVWDEKFITVLSHGLKEREDAILAFCDVAEIDELGNTLIVQSGPRIDYSGATPSIRLKKMIKTFYDGAGYGLFKRAAIENVKFPVWWGVNRSRAYNNIFPTLAYYLTKGNYVHCGDQPLWFNRIKTERNINHKIPYGDSFLRGYFAFILWKINLVVVTLFSICKGGGRFKLIISVIGPLTRYWFLVPVINQLKSLLKRLFRRQISLW